MFVKQISSCIAAGKKFRRNIPTCGFFVNGINHLLWINFRVALRKLIVKCYLEDRIGNKTRKHFH